MSLQVWLPLDGSLENKGLNDVTVTNNGAIVDDNGKIGKCYNFGSTTSKYIDIENTAMNSFTTEASVCFWLNILTWNVNYSTYFQAGTNSTSWKDYVFGLLRNNNTSKCCFTISNGTTASNNSYLTPDLELNKWYHISLVYKTGHCLIYINGQLYQDYTTSIIPNFQNISRISLGVGNNRSSYQSNCKLNDVRIYDHALSAKEIKELSKGLILHYPLDRNGFGQDNLIANSHIEKISKNSSIALYDLTATGISVVKGQTMVISADIKSDIVNSTIDCYVRSSASTVMCSNTIFTGITTEYKRYKMITVCNVNQDKTPQQFAFRSNGSNGTTTSATFKIKNVKLELGQISTPWTPAPTDDLYEDLGLNENIIYDSSGYGRNGTKIGTINYFSNTPKNIVSSVFNGSSCIKNNNFNLPDKIWTVSCWYYKPTNPTTYEGLFCLSRNAGSDADKKFAAMPNTSRIWYKGETGTASIAKLELLKWTFLAMICDGTVVKVYQNNEIIGSFNAGNEITDANDLVIGARAASVDAESTSIYFTGQMSDFRIYATALSAEDIRQLYQVSASVDRNYNFYTNEIEEVDFEKRNISKTGVISFLNFSENKGMNKNLLKGSAMTEADRLNFVSNHSTDWTKYFRYYNGSTSIHTFTKENGIYEDTVLLNSNANLGICFVRLATDIELDSTSYYTISCEAKCTKSGAGLNIGLSYYTTSNTWVQRGGSNRQLFNSINNWQKFKLTFKPDSNTYAICYCFTIVGTSGGADTFTIRKCKLEKGSEVTQWVLNEEDVMYDNSKVKITKNSELYSENFYEI